MAARRKQDAPPPSTGPSEKEVLLGFLDYQREAVVAKLQGTPEPDVRTAGVPSGTNLLGLVRHLTFVERFNFLGENTRSWPRTLVPRDGDTIESVVAGYREAVDAANEVIAACDDLTETTPRKGSPSMRWALTHMIEETGRHLGHMDILRELIDGQTGR